MNDYNAIPDDATIEKTINALKENGIQAIVVANKDKAKEKALEILPSGAQVMNMTSVTLEQTGILAAIEASLDYSLVKDQIKQLDPSTQARERRQLGAAPDYAIGSVHAVTQDGHLLIASNTGSQLAAYVYGAGHVIWVVSAKKIVKNIEDGFKRIYEYVLPQESERANKAYGITTGSFVSKLLIVNRELVKNRLTIILVKESLGF